MPAPPCVRCSKNDSTPNNFLLSCRGCSRCWHHRCHIPEVSDAELVNRIRAFNTGDLENGINAWMCRRCLKRGYKGRPKTGTEDAPIHVPESTPIPVSSGGPVTSSSVARSVASDWREEPSGSSVEVVATSFVGKPDHPQSSQAEPTVVGRRVKSTSRQATVSGGSSKPNSNSESNKLTPQEPLAPARSFLLAKPKPKQPAPLQATSPSVFSPSPPAPDMRMEVHEEDDDVVVLPSPPLNPRHAPPQEPAPLFIPSPSPADIEDLYGSPEPPPHREPEASAVPLTVEPASNENVSLPVQAKINIRQEYDLAPKWVRNYVEDMQDPDAWQRSKERKEQDGRRRPRKGQARSLASLGKFNEYYFSEDTFRAQYAKVSS